jgi:hypothetical protein
MFVKHQRLRTQYQSTTHQLLIHHPFTGTFTGTCRIVNIFVKDGSQPRNWVFPKKSLYPLATARTMRSNSNCFRRERRTCPSVESGFGVSLARRGPRRLMPSAKHFVASPVINERVILAECQFSFTFL